LRYEFFQKKVKQQKYEYTEDYVEEKGVKSRMPRIVDYLHLHKPIAVYRNQDDSNYYGF
jgi:hypothetical protein